MLDAGQFSGVSTYFIILNHHRGGLKQFFPMDSTRKGNHTIADSFPGLEQSHPSPHSHRALQTHTRFCADPPRPPSGANLGLLGCGPGARVMVGDPSMQRGADGGTGYVGMSVARVETY